MDNEPGSPSQTGDAPRVSRGMQRAYREMLTPRMLRIALITGGLALAAFVIVGPVGTYDTLTPLQRLATAVVCGALIWPMYYSLSVVTLYFLRFGSPLQTALALAAVMLVAAAPAAAITYTFLALFFAEPAARIRLPTIYLLAATASVLCSLFYHFALCQRLKRAGGSDAHEVAAPRPATGGAAVDPGSVEEAAHGGSGTPTAGVGAPGVPSFNRLPIDPDGDLIYFKSHGRDVELCTTAGSRRVPARFSDAVAQLGDQGMQVHRSYWVAHRHVAEVVQRDAQTLLRLTGDHEVPVSRTYLQSVRAAVAR